LANTIKPLQVRLPAPRHSTAPSFSTVSVMVSRHFAGMLRGFLYLLFAGHFIKPVGSSHRSPESSTAASLVVSG
jgi:hypothetical protein